MELCSLTLHDYIYNRATFVQKSPNLLDLPAFVLDNCSARLNLLNIWTIIHHICQGLGFIHGENYAHRDLKPANSKWNS
jgi:serine/threonine protein kinase